MHGCDVQIRSVRSRVAPVAAGRAVISVLAVMKVEKVDKEEFRAPKYPSMAQKDSNFTYTGLQDYLSKDTVVDTYTKLNFLIKELKNKNLPLEKKRMYLRLLIHIVGDLHQPFHVAHSSDLGANKIEVMWFKEATNLHAVWDDKLIMSQELSYTEYTNAINFTTAQQRLEWQSAPISQWLYESNHIANELYSEITTHNQKLSYAYSYEHIDTVNQQLLKGGIRLAGILNQLFGS